MSISLSSPSSSPPLSSPLSFSPSFPPLPLPPSPFFPHSMCMVLHPHSHGHGHSHNKSKGTNAGSLKEDKELGCGRKREFWRRRKKHHGHEENINVRAAFIHVIGDLIQSVGVVIAGYIIKFRVRKSNFFVHRLRIFFYLTSYINIAESLHC